MEASVIACLVVRWQNVCSVVTGSLSGRRTCVVDYGSRSCHAVSTIVNFKCSDLSVCIGIWLHALRVLAIITTFTQDLGNTKSVVLCSFHNSFVTHFYILSALFLKVFAMYGVI